MSATTNVRSAYDLEPPTYNAKLTEVGRGTPMGELLRRYWHPVGMARDAGATPRPVKILGEELILFRDGAGRPGLVYPRCCHRGTTLYYGKVEERGIRCCYHGWLFDVEGPLPGDALRAQSDRRAVPARAPALVSGRGTLRPGLRLSRSAGEEAGAAALRMPRGAGSRANSSRPTIPASAAAASRSRPATGCSISRTSSIPTMCRSCMAPSAARSSSSR